MGSQIKCAIFSYSDSQIFVDTPALRVCRSPYPRIRVSANLEVYSVAFDREGTSSKLEGFIMEDVESFAEALYDCLLFDLDDTLYPLSSGLQAACRKNIEEYMVQNLNIDECKVPSMCVELYKTHGTTMAGLKALGYEFDNDEFHSFVHGRLPYENLRPDPVLRSLLLSMPQRKIVFTNADRVHAAKVLNRLELEDCFEGVICFETLNPCPQATDITDGLETDKQHPEDTGSSDAPNPRLQAVNNTDARENDNLYSEATDNGDACETGPNPKSRILCKPSPEAFQFALNIANADPKRAIFFDDSVRNIATAKATGMHCVLVGGAIKTEAADFALGSIHNIKEAIPEIWENEEIPENAACSNPAVTIQTAVVA